MGRAVFIAAAAFALGIAAGTSIGFLAGSSRTRPPPVDEPAAETPPVESVPLEIVEKVEHRIVRSSARAVSDLIASVPVPAVERGEGTISGVVRTDAGDPLPGVRVRADRYPEDRFSLTFREPKEPSLEEEVRSAIEEARRRRTNRWEAVTGEDGSFALTGLPQGGYGIDGTKEGYEISNADRRGGSARLGDSVELVGRAMIEVPVQVLMPDGSPAEEARIGVRTPEAHRGGMEPWSADRPFLKLRAGIYRVRAYQGAHEELLSNEEEIALEGGVKAPLLTLQLKGRPGIQGQILYQEGDPFKVGQAHIARIQPARPPDPSRLCDSRTRIHRRDRFGWGQVESAATFAFTDLASGKYLLGLSRGGGRILATEVVEVADNMVRLELAMPALQRSDYVVLWVYGPHGRLLPEVDVSTGLRTAGGGSSSSNGGEVRRPDGSYWVLHQEWCGKEGEDAVNSVSVRAPGFPEKDVDYTRTQTNELTIHFEEPGFLEVTLTDFAPGNYEGNFQVGLERAVEEEPEEETAEPGTRRTRPPRRSLQNFSADEEPTDGIARFGPLETGAYEVKLAYGSGRHETMQLHAQPVTVRAGKNSMAIPVPRLFTLTVAVAGLGSKAHVRVRPAQQEDRQSWGQSAEVGAGERVSFDGMLPGEYKVTLSRNGEELEEVGVTLPAQTEIQLQARKRDAMQVAGLGADAVLAKAGVQDGDLIVAVNGAAFEGKREWWELVNKASEAKEITLLVERGGQSFEVTVPARGFQRGANLQPASR